MFLLPLIFLPFILILAVRRLIQIPIALHRGDLHFPAHRRRLLALVSAAGYLLLLIYTVALSVAIFRAALTEPNTVAAWMALAAYIAAYPLIYLMVAWVFHHTLKKR